MNLSLLNCIFSPLILGCKSRIKDELEHVETGIGREGKIKRTPLVFLLRVFRKTLKDKGIR